VELDGVADPGGTGPAELDGKRKLARRRPDNHADRLFRSRVRRLHQLGPRATGELLAGLDPAWVRWTGTHDWLDERDLIRLVGGRS
jgi:hypothetical protein